MLIMTRLLALVWPMVLRKYDFTRLRVLNDLSAVDEVAGMDVNIAAIRDNCGRKVISSCLNKTPTKSDAVSTSISG